MERAVGKNEKFESLKVESFCLSWKERSEVRKDHAKLERTERSRKVSLQLESLNELGKLSRDLESVTALFNSK